MPDLQAGRQALAAASAQRATLDAELAAAGAQLAAERANLVRLRAAGDVDGIQAARVRINELAGRRRSAIAATREIVGLLRLALDGLLGDELDLEGDVPLVLLPVRIEVRSTLDRTALRIRIFPDAVHTESLDEGLTDAERAAGIAYWTAVWVDGDSQKPWAGLVAAATVQRAPWVAEALRPLNLASRAADPPTFPETVAPRAATAVARTLPDRFHVRIEQDGHEPRTVTGKAIPDELPVGLANQDDLSALELADDDLPLVDAGMRWLIDYDEAENVGMAVTVPLDDPDVPVTRVVAYGVRAALGPVDSAKRLDRLVRSHRFTDGAEFVAQGTPTNNTDSVTTPWSRRTPPGPPEFAAADAPAPGSNAAVVAAALGIDPAVAASLPGAREAEQPRAQAFNSVLWATTWGEAIEQLSPAGRANGDDRLDTPSIEAIREHWTESVRGRGPVPALLLGRQPYGVLPVVETGDAWKPLRGGFVEDTLVPYINQSLRPYWKTAVQEVATVMDTPIDQALPEILGTDAILRGLLVRTGLAAHVIGEAASAQILPDLGQRDAQQQVHRVLSLLWGVGDDQVDVAQGSRLVYGEKTSALALPLVHDSDLEFIAALLEPVPRVLEQGSVLQVLLAHAHAIERYHRDSIVAPGGLGQLVDAIPFERLNIDRRLVREAAEAVDAAAFDRSVVAEAADRVIEAAGRLDGRFVADLRPIPGVAAGTLVEQIGGREPNAAALGERLGAQIVGEAFQAAKHRAAFLAGLQTMSTIESLEERRLLLSETLDCCSHRLDAWITAAATRRLSEMRAGGAKGSFIGAYGWLEDVQLREPVIGRRPDGTDVLVSPADGGFVHAPSLVHAATAGVLRSSRLAHGGDDPDTSPFGIDLSSSRVRDALALLDGMRRGQQLGALLGYRLERRLHELSGGILELDRFIAVLRSLAPLRAGKLTDPGAPVMESLAASDVVDGLRLLDLADAEIVAKLRAGPDDKTYIGAGWVAPRPGEEPAVLAAIRELHQTHDAVADLLLAESVHQIVSGNPARAAAALDVLGAGEADAPEPEVVRTPRSGIPLRQRVTIVVPPAAAPAVGWSLTSPRALAEPRLEIWAQAALGDPASIRVGERSLVAVNLSALDVLYDADGAEVANSTLGFRLRLAAEAYGDDPTGIDLAQGSALALLWETAGLLRSMLSAGRPLDVGDVGAAQTAGAAGRVIDGPELLARATASRDQLAAATTAIDPSRLLAFGIRPAPTVETIPLAADELLLATDSLVRDGLGRVKAATALLDRAAALIAEAGSAFPRAAAELAMQALRSIFGSGFQALPLVLAPPPGEPDLWDGAVGPDGIRARPGAEVRPWLARAGALRDSTGRYGETLLVREAQHRPPLLRVIQTPAGSYGRWVGLPFLPEPPLQPIASMVAEIAGVAAGDAEPDLRGTVVGLVLDEWTEVIPRRLLVGNPDGAQPTDLVEVTTTGIALGANAPAARPPQSILIALSPDGAPWTGERLVGLLDEALALAQMRAVTLPQVPFAGRYLPALYFRDWSLQGEPLIDFSKLQLADSVADALSSKRTLQFLMKDDR